MGHDRSGSHIRPGSALNPSRGVRSSRPGAVVRHYRKRRQNAPRTEERQVLYELHPWFGRPVRLHEVLEKSGGKVFRCSCDDDAVGRRLELPGWMFDRVACAPIQTVAVPLVELAALQALRLLLTVALRQRVSGDASSTAPDFDAALASQQSAGLSCRCSRTRRGSSHQLPSTRSTPRSPGSGHNSPGRKQH